MENVIIKLLEKGVRVMGRAPITLFGSEDYMLVITERVIDYGSVSDAVRFGIVYREMPGIYVVFRRIIGFTNVREELKGVMPPYTTGYEDRCMVITQIGVDYSNDDSIVDFVINFVNGGADKLVDSIKSLLTYPINEDAMESWIQRIRERLPTTRMRLWANRHLARYRAMYGMNANALLQTLMFYINTLLRTRYRDEARLLNDEANRLLQLPSKYVWELTHKV